MPTRRVTVSRRLRLQKVLNLQKQPKENRGNLSPHIALYENELDTTRRYECCETSFGVGKTRHVPNPAARSLYPHKIESVDAISNLLSAKAHLEFLELVTSCKTVIF